jgi:uncharacterized membrane protein YdbT with pleckstrin-like domain
MISFRENEHILFEVRKHWFVIATELSVLLLFAFIPLVIPQFIDSIGYTLNFAGNNEALGTVGVTGFWPIYIFFYSLWLLFLWIMAFVFWTNYYLDVWVVTNEKIVDVEQVALFRREVSLLHLDRIQDVTTETKGLLQTLMKFGDLHVQTAGQQREFLIDNVSNPDEVGKKLNEILMKFKEVPQPDRPKDSV